MTHARLNKARELAEEIRNMRVVDPPTVADAILAIADVASAGEVGVVDRKPIEMEIDTDEFSIGVDGVGFILIP